MFFYVDESGHTGSELFDPAQPVLCYGVLSSHLNVDAVAEGRIKSMRRKLGVGRLHAAELGNGRLVTVADDLFALQRQLDLRFDLYRVFKPDHAIISFFDQVFDAGLNPAVPWTGYWTPMRYMLLLKVAHLFDEALARAAWAARIMVDTAKATPAFVAVCEELLTRVPHLPDARARELVRDGVRWAMANPNEIGYNATDKAQVKQISPNIIGFQSVMHGIAGRLRQRGGRTASRIVVDQQSEFNKAQKTLAEFFAKASGMKHPMGPGMPEANFTNMPTVPIECVPGTTSGGLELVDVYLWTFKRAMEGKEVARELHPIINAQLRRGKTDEISLRGIEHRWATWFEQLPQLDEMTPEQLQGGKEILQIQETRRQAALAALPAPAT
jgi:hypothetical protein